MTLQGKKFDNGVLAPLNGIWFLDSIVGSLKSVDLTAFCGYGCCGRTDGM